MTGNPYFFCLVWQWQELPHPDITCPRGPVFPDGGGSSGPSDSGFGWQGGGRGRCYHCHLGGYRWLADTHIRGNTLGLDKTSRDLNMGPTPICLPPPPFTMTPPTPKYCLKPANAGRGFDATLQS